MYLLRCDLFVTNVSRREKELGSLINQYIRFHQTVPIALLLENIGATGVRNIFAELTYRSTANSTILLTQKPTIDETSDLWSDTIIQLRQWSNIEHGLSSVSSLPEPERNRLGQKTIRS